MFPLGVRPGTSPTTSPTTLDAMDRSGAGGDARAGGFQSGEGTTKDPTGIDPGMVELDLRGTVGLLRLAEVFCCALADYCWL